MENIILTASDWSIKFHEERNLLYDTYLPYEFHLRMVYKVYLDWINILPEGIYHKDCGLSYRDVVGICCWTHDLIEDTSANYNTILKKFGYHVAEITRAVTNYNRGRNRDERMPPEVYADIRNTPGATFVKLCDRIANVQYGKMVSSRMFEVYRNENEHFIDSLGFGKNGENTSLLPMVIYLRRLFNA